MIAMEPVVTSALIGAGASAIAGGTSAVAQGSLNRKTREFNREEAEKQRAWNEAMADKQNAWNYDMWLKTNEYNDPTHQVERLRDAGLNPLYYGLDGSAANQLNAAQPLGYERAKMDNMPNPVSAGLDAAIKVAQVSNIQADTAKKNNENLTETQKREKLLADIDEVRQNIKLKMSQEGLTDSQRQKLEKDIEWLDRLNEATLAEKESNAALNRSQKERIDKLLEGEQLLQAKTIEDFDKKWSKIRAEIAKMSKETGLLQKDIENYALNHANNGFMGTGLSVTNLIRAVQAVTGNENTAEGKEKRRRNADAAATIYDHK